MVPLTMASLTWLPSCPFPLSCQTKSTMMAGNAFAVHRGMRLGPVDINKTREAVAISLGRLTTGW